MRRLDSGGAIDRDRPVNFTFNGKRYQGYAGDTLASALLANGVRLVARSFKYHRPRGVVTAGGEETNALVQVNGTADDPGYTEPNVRATVLSLVEGLNTSSVNCWPGPGFDIGAINSTLSPLLPAGFYYKTFMLGRWDRYSNAIRRAAGLGKAPERAAEKRYEKRHAHTDVLVVGAGPAGLAAAVEASKTGARVMLVDEQETPGGHLLNLKVGDVTNEAIEALAADPETADRITYLPRTTATGYYDHNLIVAVERQPADAPWIFERLWHIRADEVVHATGAVERPLVFANNDRPGVMLATAARTYVNRYGVAPGNRAVFFTNNSSAYDAVFDLDDAGVTIGAVIDARPEAEQTLLEACRERGITVYSDSVVVNVTVPGLSVQNERSVGACAGDFDYSRQPYQCDPLWEVQANGKSGKSFVDFQNDVTTSDIELALRENFESIEHVKRYTTAGMATDQGKIGNANVIGVVADRLAAKPDEIGTTTYRPPFTPVSFGALGGSDRGALILPTRTTPITPWNIDHGAAMNEAGGNFRRPFWFPEPGESDASAIARAAKAVRNGAGIYDATPLGKFELHGPDVPELLNLLYTNRFDNLNVGHGRFGLMLREDGRLLDDGVTFRLEDHWLMTCGTGAASGVLRHIEHLLQTELTHLKVYAVNVTSQWANICVCGPKSRDVLQAAGIDIALDGDFKFMQMKPATVAGFDARVARVSYTGELSFEINTRRRNARELWQALMQAGEAFDLTPVGSETSAVLRIEKGFISAGSEGDNITNPFDAGLSWIVDMDKPDFIGKRTLMRDLEFDIPRQHVVGLLPDDKDFVVAEGSALLPELNSRDFQGHVTASCYSPTLERPVALALLKNGKHRHGEEILISGLNRSVRAEVTKPVFYDPKGERMRG